MKRFLFSFKLVLTYNHRYKSGSAEIIVGNLKNMQKNSCKKCHYEQNELIALLGHHEFISGS